MQTNFFDPVKSPSFYTEIPAVCVIKCSAAWIFQFLDNVDLG